MIGIGIPVAGEEPTSLLNRALEILSREAARWVPAPAAAPGLPSAPVPVDRTQLQRQIQALVDSVLTRTPATPLSSESPAAIPAAAMVPVLSARAPVQAGAAAEIPVTVTNEDVSDCRVSLYCTNLTSESGHEIPSLRVSITPRQVVLSPAASASFTVRVAVSPQSAPGQYAGLIQAAGAKYVRAVICVDVL